MPSKQKYLVTGGAGFIGSHLAERLLADGHDVTVIDDLSTGRWSNIAPLAERENFRAVIADADDAELVDREVSRCDFVYHLASAVGVKLIVDQPVETVRRIVRPTERITDACSKYRKAILLTSTSEVYGKSEKIPFREEDDIVSGPTSKRRWAYATAKALDEFYLLAHYAQTSLPVRIVRLFNTVGPRQSAQYGMVLPRFVEAALADEPLYVYGDGEQRRCFSAVADIIEGLVKISASAGAVGRVVNLGSNEEVSINALAARVIALTGSKSEIRYKTYDEAYGRNFDDMRRRIPSLERAQQLIGWNPKYSLDDIIRQVIDDKKTARQ